MEHHLLDDFALRLVVHERRRGHSVLLREEIERARLELERAVARRAVEVFWVYRLGVSSALAPLERGDPRLLLMVERPLRDWRWRDGE